MEVFKNAKEKNQDTSCIHGVILHDFPVLEGDRFNSINLSRIVCKLESVLNTAGVEI